MSDTDHPVLFTVLHEASAKGDSYSGTVAERLVGWLDDMGLTLVGYDEDGTPIKHDPQECTAEQQLRAARFLEYELRDAIVIAKNNQSKASTESKSKRIERLSGELEALMAALPARLPGAELERLLTQMTCEVCAEHAHESTTVITARVLKRLRTAHFGRYDARSARDLIQHLVASIFSSSVSARP